ncbi:MAG: MBL fold metallo-hydrolase [Pseudomonadota bacterium]
MASNSALQYLVESKPEHGDVTAIADGIDWLRMPLPFSLEHINLWMLKDDAGFCIVDTGVDSKTSRDIWRNAIIETAMGDAVTRVIVTHLHPDHVGLAGWLCDVHGVELWMTREEYLLCRILVADTGQPAPEEGLRFYRTAGFSEEQLTRYGDMFGMFGRVVSPLPQAYRRLCDGDELIVGGETWRVIIGRGHSPEHACLFNADRNIVISGDQILPTISSNVSVYPTEPYANPLKDWLDSLRMLRTTLPDDVLVLPAHGKPFRGAHQRLEELIKEHEDGLGKILESLDQPKRAVDIFDALFKARISDSNLIMATGESVAHLNYLVATGDIAREVDDVGVTRYART